ncbi:MAG: ATP-binding protein [Anaerolineae bacterium]|nr:ATP-binding protein [Thermoflexales bacterium]MDW8407520.1 ATP-binding protein [Anaerolineae bacterium]
MLPDYRVRQRDYLLQISRAITSQLDLDQVLRLILQSAVDMLNGQAGIVALVEPDGSYQIRQAYGVAKPILDELKPMLATAADVHEAAELLEGSLIALAKRFGIGFWQVVSLPLQAGDDFLGAIYIFRIGSGGFSANDRQILQSFADQAAVAVNNARLYQAVAQEKRRLDAILEFSGDGIAILDGAHLISRFNRALSKMTGIAPAAAIGRRFEDVVRIVDQRAGRTLVEAEANGWPLVESAHPLFIEGDLMRADNKRVSVEINFSPLFDREGRLVNIIANVRDITRFREADEMKSTFVSIVSHELKTPVALIKGYASTLRRQDARWDEQTVRESLQVIEEESDRLARLIDDLLDATRVQSGNFRLTPVEMELDDLVRNVVRKFQSQTKRHTLIADVPADLPMVYADEARITQVLSNLLSNAIKYSPEGGEIRVSSTVTPKEVIISVSDQGPGISPEDQKHLFTRFFRANNALTRKTQGAGLGLYLSKAIIEAHGGRIWVESDGQHGARFSFSLPRA